MNKILNILPCLLGSIFLLTHCGPAGNIPMQPADSPQKDSIEHLNQALHTVEQNVPTNNQLILKEEKNDSPYEPLGSLTALYQQGILHRLLFYVEPTTIDSLRTTNRLAYTYTTGYQKPGIKLEDKNSQAENKDKQQIFLSPNYMKGYFLNNMDFHEIKGLSPASRRRVRFWGSTEMIKQILPEDKVGQTEKKDIHQICVYPSQTRNGFINNQKVDFGKIENPSPESTPRLSFCQLLGKAIDLPQKFWPYIKLSNINTLAFHPGKMGPEMIKELVDFLPGSQVYTIDLWKNKIGKEGAKALAKILPKTQVHHLNLGSTGIDFEELKTIIDSLGGKNEISVNLQYFSSSCYNKAKALAEKLKNKIRCRLLFTNHEGSSFSSKEVDLLETQYPNIEWIFDNSMSGSGNLGT